MNDGHQDCLNGTTDIRESINRHRYFTNAVFVQEINWCALVAVDIIF